MRGSQDPLVSLTFFAPGPEQGRLQAWRGKSGVSWVVTRGAVGEQVPANEARGAGAPKQSFCAGHGR